MDLSHKTTTGPMVLRAENGPKNHLRCPVCRSAIGSGPKCARCRANVLPLLKIVAAARELREEARQAIDEGNIGRGVVSLEKSLKLHESPRARRFLWLARFIGTEIERIHP